MKHLVISLYIGVFVVLLGLGWGIDQYYSQTFDDSRQQPYQGYHAALTMAVQQLSAIAPDQQQMQKYLQQQKLEFALEPLSDIPLPDSLSMLRDRGEIFILQSDNSDTLYQQIPNTSWLLSLEIQMSDDEQKEAVRYVLTLLFYAGVAAILLLWLLPLLRGIRQLNLAAKKIGEGDLHTRVEHPNSLYLKPLKTEFNAMASRLQQLNENNRFMSQAVSHELRTPLSRLRFALDMLHGREDQQQREQDMRRMEADLDDMEALINELLNYARLDQQPALDLEPIKIEALIEQRVQRQLDLGCNIELLASRKSALISGDHDSLCKLVDNLIQNACRYASSKVLIRCHWNDTQFCFSIEDDGSGIDADQMEQIFKPFFRVKNQAVKKSSGFGLGLAIVKRIVQWHQGQINAGKSEQLGGARFEVLLPISTQ